MIVYLLGIRLLITYTPSWLAMVLKEAPRSVSVTVILTLGTTAPVGSVTMPDMAA